jgi:hypothetical protein
MDTTQIPPITREFVQWLASHFPDKLPDPATPQHEIIAKCGEQRVVRFLRAQHEMQSATSVFPASEDSTQ